MTASGISPDEDGNLTDIETSGVRLYGLDTTGDGEIDEVVVEEIDVEVVDED
jgi:hypothetical protein